MLIVSITAETKFQPYLYHLNNAHNEHNNDLRFLQPKGTGRPTKENSG